MEQLLAADVSQNDAAASVQLAEIRDDVRIKTYADGSREQIYMIYLIFDCHAANRDVTINDEFDDYAWVPRERLADYEADPTQTFAAFVASVLADYQ